MTRSIHEDGHPDYCAADCNGPHFEDAASEVCPECGGSGKGCFYGCRERQQRGYDEFEGHTGAEYAYEGGSLF